MSKNTNKADDVNEALRKKPVAIIGMASIFPQASNLQEYWDNILNKINSVTDVPLSRWSVEDYYDPDPKKPDKSYCKRGGFIPDIDFDPTEFGLPPNILEVTDVSQLLSLVVARDALEDAGYGEGIEFNRQNTGVVLGVVGVSTKLYVPLMSRLQYPIWEKVLRTSGVSEDDISKIVEKIKLAYVGWEENSFPGSLANVVSGRVANRFDLGGTNCVMDAACATSLAAIRMSVMELVEGRMDMMITGGVDTDNSIGVYMSFSKTPAFSKGESVKTFDADSDGMMAGEGLGMFVLKRLEDAERDGNRIYAVIQGVGSSSDGRYKSIYAPSPSGQAVALRRAYQDAGYLPSTVGLIEAHGTGTPAGDPAEFQGLREVFTENNPDRQTIALGSVKSQIAHTKGAAGAAGMIKAALALYYKVLPPTINVKVPNPKLDIANSPFYINTETRPWFRQHANTPRRAGVSAFGFGGTNFHVTLEEHESDHLGAYRRNSVGEMIILTAENGPQLMSVCQETLLKLQTDGETSYKNLVLSSKNQEIPVAYARIGFVSNSITEAQEQLQTAIDMLKQRPQDDVLEHPKGIYYRKTGMDVKNRLVALFSGQGSQYLEMGKELACNFPPIRQAFSEMDDLFDRDGLKPLSSRVYPAPVFDSADKDLLSDALTRTEHAQPAIGAFSRGQYKVLRQAGFKPEFIAGHSFGELTALWAAGVLSDKDYNFLAKARGKAMSPPDDPNFDAGTMLAVKGDARKVAEDIKDFPEITLANWNSDTQVVLAGSKPAVAKVQQYLSDKGYSVMPLPVSAAFHTPLVGHSQKPFAAAINSVTFQVPQVRLYSNTTGKAHEPNSDSIRKLLEGHILKPVLFRDEIENIYSEGGQIFVEFGPKNVLTNLVKSILGDRPHLAVALNSNAKKNSDRQFREAVLQLRIAGVIMGEIDPYRAPEKAPSSRKKSPVTIKLGGGLFTSPKTMKAFEDALQDGFKISGTKEPLSLRSTTPSSSMSVSAPTLSHSAVISRGIESQTQVVPDGNTYNPAAAEVLGTSLTQLREQQSEVVRLHEQYLKNEEAYGRIFAKLSEMEVALVTNTSQDKIDQIIPVFEGLERSMDRFHDHQSETLQVHAQYLKSQEEYSQAYLRMAQQQAGISGQVVFQSTMPAVPVIQAPTIVHSPTRVALQTEQKPIKQETRPLPQAEKETVDFNQSEKGSAKPALTSKAQAPIHGEQAAYDRATLTASLLNVVSEKTGYPVEMLNLETDMESDLGIDSIKKVEIMGAMRNLFPSLPKADPEAFAEARTLGQNIDYMMAGNGDTSSGSDSDAPALAAAEAQPLKVTAVSTDTIYDRETLTTSLLNVVSEKTGYPVEMLNLETDMESDLGIDSIKKVEIMGAMRNLFPSLPKADPDAFAEARTLGQNIDYMMAGKGDTSSGSDSDGPAFAAAEVQPLEATAISTDTIYDRDTLTASLLNVVSEKTGYPVEMLNLETDMESDLGIDSIKKVEIMGALRSQFPNLPKADPEAFAEARTLGQIIDYMIKGEQVDAINNSAVEEQQPELSGPSITRGIVELKVLPEPDFSSFNLPKNHICILTDDGTPSTTILAKELFGRGWKVLVMSYPESIVAAKSSLPKGVERVTLIDLSEEHLQQKLVEIKTKYGPTAAFVHLNPSISNENNPELFSTIQMEIIKHVFLLAKHLKDQLTSAAVNGKSIFMVVTRMDGQFGLGNNMDFDPISGGLFGLVKSLNLEWGAVFCRGIDFNPNCSIEDTTAHILAELHDPNRLITEVAYNQHERTTLVVEQQGNEVKS